MSTSNIFELRKKGHLIIMLTALLYIILSFAPALDRYFFVFQLILFAQGLTFTAQSIVGFVRLKETRELLRSLAALFIFIAALCVGGISNTILIKNIPAWLYIYYFAGYLPAFLILIAMTFVYSYSSKAKFAARILALLGIVCCFGYFFLTSRHNKFIDFSFPFFGNRSWLLNIAAVEIIFQFCVITLSVPLFCSRDKNSISNEY